MSNDGIVPHPKHVIEIDDNGMPYETIELRYQGKHYMTLVVCDTLTSDKFPAMMLAYSDPERNPFLQIELPKKIRS